MKFEPKEIEKYFEVNDDESKVRELQDELTEEKAWGTPSACCNLSENFIREFADKVDWGCITCNQDLSPQFIKEFVDKIDWEHFCHYQIITKELVDKVQDYINWRAVIFYNKLSEDIIEKYLYKWDEMDRSDLLKHQKLSEDFLRRHKELWWDDEKNVGNIFKYQKPFSKEFKKELILRHRELIYDYYNKKYGDK